MAKVYKTKLAKKAHQPGRLPYALLTATGPLIVLFAMTLTFWGIFRTFDFTDEAWSLGLIQDPSNTIRWEFTYFQFFTNWLFDSLGNSVIPLRIIRFGLHFVVAIFGASTVSAALLSSGRDIKFTNRLAVHAIAQVGGLLSWFWSPSILGYNELNAFLLQISAFAMIRLFIRRKFAFNSPLAFADFIPALFAGLLGSLTFYTKFSTFLLFIIVYAIFSFLLNSRKIWVSIIWTTVPLLIPALSIVGSPSVQTYFGNILDFALNPNVRNGYAHGNSVLFVYAADAILNASIILAPIFIISTFGKLRLNSDANTRLAITQQFPFATWFVNSVLALAVIIWVFDPRSTASQTTGRLAIAILSFAIALALSSFKFEQLRQVGHLKLFALGLALFLPLLHSFGTNVVPSTHLGYTSISWFCLLGFFSLQYSERMPASLTKWKIFFPPLVVIVVSALALGAIAKNMTLSYRSESIFAQKVMVETPGPLIGLSLDQSEVDFVKWLHTQNINLGAQSNPTISLNGPGSLVLFNNSPFGRSWLEMPSSESFKSVLISCKNTPALPSLYLIKPSKMGLTDENIQELNHSMEPCGFSFPSDFILLAEGAGNESRFRVQIYGTKSKK